jgi:hypothetical protein
MHAGGDLLLTLGITVSAMGILYKSMSFSKKAPERCVVVDETCQLLGAWGLFGTCD